MAVDYTGADNGLFVHLGKYVKYFNEYLAAANDGSTGLDANRKEILDALNAGPQFVAVQGFSDEYERWKLHVVDQRATLARYMLIRLQDPASILTQIGAVSTDAVEIVSKLIVQMIADSETVEESDVTIGTVTAGASNAGDGKVFATDILDGVSSPGSRAGLQYPPLVEYEGLGTELAVPDETMVLRCTDDGSVSGTTEFLWEGQYSDPAGQYGLEPEGSGQIGTVAEVHQSTDGILTNADFEEFTSADEPDGWEIVSGTAGTHILENDNLADVSHGLKSLQYVGDGAESAISIKQAIPAGAVNPRQRYLVSAQIKADASVTNGDLTIEFEGTGYTPGGTEKIEIAAGSLPTDFDTRAFFVTMPAVIPSDFALVIKWTDTPTSGKNLYIDDLGIAPVTYGGGIGVAVVRGPIPFSLGDRFSFTVENDEGVFQAAFRRVFGFQLPSSDTPTIDDSLAE